MVFLGAKVLVLMKHGLFQDGDFAPISVGLCSGKE
jgi:hypothetical protein